MPRVKITDTTFRDAHQSLAATRMRMRHMVPIIEKMDEVGFFSMEVWGGATFDACIRYLNEDPWERIRTFKKHMKNTPTQMLLRGQNLVGYKHYSDDIVEKFVEKAYRNGVDIFRIFDALNDIRNMEFAIRVAKRLGAHVQGTICYTISPVHTIESFVELAKRLEELECDSLCIKDMAGLISPQAARDLVSALKKEISIPIDLHSHCTSGMAPISYFAAIEAGVDIIDTAMSPFAWGTSQPPTESMVAALKGTPYDTGIDLEAFAEITPYFKEIRKRYDAIIEDISEMVDVNVLLYQIPGGMMSNLISQLKEQNALDRLPEVLEEVPRVRKDLGYPPLVTPTSQIVGTQAVMNVLVGERYKVVPKEVKDYVRGLYGRPPGPIDEEVKAKIIGDEEVITCRPADLLKPQLHQLEKEAEKLGIIKKEEDLLTYALYPAIAVKFLRGEMREEPLPERREAEAEAERGIPTEYLVEVDGEEFSVRVKPVGGFMEITQAAEQPRAPPKEVEGGIKAPMQGMIVKINVKKGDEVKKGDVVAVLEAMKMQNDVVASHDGRVEEIFVEEGANVSAGDVIMAVR
ncbi:MAG: sodium-extruding oxaloacetate decarboxylase subunit alpha [Euryarchaeota archaeon]|nr:sodium-extruding oxaloacetate decarboxylase subunit alpha [Euryarchaeota archaeon]